MLRSWDQELGWSRNRVAVGELVAGLNNIKIMPMIYNLNFDYKEVTKKLNIRNE